MGYKIYSKVLNAKDFGVPQNRERIYIVAFLDNVDFDFPNNLNKNVSIHDMFETKIDDKYYYNNKPLFEKIKDDIEKEYYNELKKCTGPRFPFYEVDDLNSDFIKVKELLINYLIKIEKVNSINRNICDKIYKHFKILDFSFI